MVEASVSLTRYCMKERRKKNSQPLRAERFRIIVTASAQHIPEKLTVKDSLEAYRFLGLSRTTWLRDLEASKQPVLTDLGQSLFVQIEEDNTITLLDEQEIHQALGLVQEGHIAVLPQYPETYFPEVDDESFSVPESYPHDLSSLDSFELFIYNNVAHAMVCDDDGGVTQTRASRRQVTGVSESTQRRRENRLNVRRRRNFAYLGNPNDRHKYKHEQQVLWEEYRVRQQPGAQYGDMFEIKSTLYGNVTPISYYADAKTYTCDMPIVEVGRRQEHRPEFGEYNWHRLTYRHDNLPSPDVLYELVVKKHQDVYIEISNNVDMFTGEIHGIYMCLSPRLVWNCKDVDALLMQVIKDRAYYLKYYEYDLITNPQARGKENNVKFV